MDFRQGDRVIFRNFDGIVGNNLPHVGERGIVKKESHESKRAYVKWGGGGKWFNFSNLAHDFNVGDRIIGNSLADKAYKITKTGFISEVLGSGDGGLMRIKGDQESPYFDVDPAFFDPYRPAKTSKKIELLEVDLSKPDLAREKLEKLLKDYAERFMWTQDEIREADDISRSIINSMMDDFVTPVFYFDKANGQVLIDTSYGSIGRRNHYKAACCTVSGKDIFNEHIGRCVCLCKSTGRDIPEFIMNKNRG